MMAASNLRWWRTGTRRGLRCKWTKDITTLVLEEFDGRQLH
jgi:hypothetical protein